MQWMARTDDGSNSTGPCVKSHLNVGLHRLHSLLLLLLKVKLLLAVDKCNRNIFFLDLGREVNEVDNID